MSHNYDKHNATYFWNKKIIVSYFLCVLVFYIHIPSFANYDIHSSTDLISRIDVVAEFAIKKLFTPFAVPLFFIISGFLFYNGLTWETIPKKIKKRTRSLLIPYLLWNTIWMFFTLFEYYVLKLPSVPPVKPIESILLCKNNGAFWFIFNLYVFALFSPLIFMLIRNKYFGLVVLVLVAILIELGIELPKDPFYRGDSLFFYLFGALLGKHYENWFSRCCHKCYEFMIYLIVFVICVLCTALQTKAIQDALGNLLYLTLYAVSFWRIIDKVINKLRVKPFMKRSFMVYAMHVHVGVYVSKLLLYTLPRNNYFCIINSLCTIVLVLVFINYFSVFLEKKMLVLYNFLTGDR